MYSVRDFMLSGWTLADMLLSSGLWNMSNSEDQGSPNKPASTTTDWY